MNFLKRVAPCFAINEGNIRILSEPNDFYEYIKSKAAKCRKRIVIASLYLGTGYKEKSLVDSISDSIKSNINNNNFRVHLLFDAVRGSRSVIDCHGNFSSSRLMCLPLLQNRSNVKVSFYQTPNLRGWLYKWLPEKWNEVVGLQHMKVYLFDDCIVMSGANLSEDYFTNRQDRYIAFENCPLLCDFYEELVNIVGFRSYQMNSLNEFESPKLCCDPISGNFEKYISEFRTSIESFLAVQIDKSQQRHSSKIDRCSTHVYPLIQMGLYGIVQDQTVLSSLFQTLSVPNIMLDGKENNDQHNVPVSVSLASGYFNLDHRNEQLIFEMCQKNIWLEILTAHPEANGFFKANGILKYIPDVYTDILNEFQLKSSHLPIKTLEWKRAKWTFHAKGFWISRDVSESTGVSISLIGSTNYGYRSCFKDLESELLIETVSDKLRRDLLDEKNRLFQHGIEAMKTREQHRPTPFWIHWIVPIVKYFF